MGCVKSLTLSTAISDQPMDAACFDNNDGFIYAVRGGRIFRANATTGVIVGQSDYNNRLRSGASVCYDSGTDTLWAGGWNDPSSQRAVGNIIPTSSYFSPRSLSKITPATLAVAQEYDLDTIFPALSILDSSQQFPSGVVELRSVGAFVLANIVANDGGFFNMICYQIRFDPSNIATFTTNNGAINCGQIAYVGPTIWVPDVSTPQIQEVDISADNTLGNTLATWAASGPPKTTETFFPIAVEYSPDSAKLYMTSQDVAVPGNGQFIYTSTTVPVERAKIDLGRAGFQGVHIRRCPTGPATGLLFATGYGDNTVAVINPTAGVILGVAANDGFIIKTGFDLPDEIVFTNAKVWAVQQGTVPFKEVVLP